jgi:hypothetical protein
VIFRFCNTALDVKSAAVLHFQRHSCLHIERKVGHWGIRCENWQVPKYSRYRPQFVELGVESLGTSGCGFPNAPGSLWKVP